MAKAKKTDDDMPADIRITDEVIKRMIAREQRRIGDPNPTKTAGRIIERYFAMMGQRTEEPAAAIA